MFMILVGRQTRGAGVWAAFWLAGAIDDGVEAGGGRVWWWDGKKWEASRARTKELAGGLVCINLQLRKLAPSATTAQPIVVYPTHPTTTQDHIRLRRQHINHSTIMAKPTPAVSKSILSPSPFGRTSVHHHIGTDFLSTARSMIGV